MRGFGARNDERMSSNPVQPAMSGPSTVHSLASGDDVKKKRKHKANIRVAALNITSMMDLVLNLLLFFVLTASFAASEGILPANLPTGGGGGGAAAEILDSAATPEVPVVVTLHGIGDQPAIIQVEGSPETIQDYEDLYLKLRAWRQDPETNPQGIYKPDQSIVIRPDRNVKWKHVVDSFNALVRAQYTNIGFAPPG
jgi:biopolymer transport protein ExbD